MEKRMENSAFTDDRSRRRRAAGCMPWRKYAVIYKSVLLESLQYAANMVMGFFSYFIFIFIFVKLWGYIYQTPGELIAGYTKEQMIWYVMMTEMIWFGSNAASVAGEVSGSIRGGNIAYLMNRPYHYTLYVLTKYTGEWSVRLPMYMMFAVVIGTVMVGPLPRFPLAAVPGMALCVVLGLTINAVFKICISLLSFWIEDATPFQWLYDKLLLVVGTMFPVEIFPIALQPLFKLTPIYTVCYGPAKLIVDFSSKKCVEILAAQAVYLAVGGALMLLIYKKGVKKLYVNGG
jgi:ABC-2 type transport system permease protein